MSGLARRGESMQDRFGRELLSRFQARAGVVESWYSAQRFAIGYRRVTGGVVHWAHLGSLYAECAGLAGERRDAVLARYVMSMTEPATVPRDWAAAAPLLRPVLCGAATGRSAPGVGHGGAELVRRSVLPFLDEVVVLDLPTTLGHVTGDLVAAWQVPVAEVFAAARANLAADRRSVLSAALREPTMLRFVDDGAAYWVSRLLVDGWLAGLADLVGGRPVAFAPDRDSLLVVRDGPQLAGLFDIVAAEYRESTRPVSPVAYTTGDDGRVVPYRVPAGDPAYDAVARANRQLAASAYDTQADLLRAEWSLAGRFSVASYLLVEPDGAAPVSVSTWRQDVATLLPVTDRVALVSGDRRESWLIGWDRLMSTGTPRRVPGLAPPRYRVGPWPTGDRWHHLVAGAWHRADGALG
ncbi:MAG TPA: hypothetical protein VGN37_17325 [Actinocatenispora sp.]